MGWLDDFFAGLVVQSGGMALPQRSALNFIGSGFTIADDPANVRTNITLAVDPTGTPLATPNTVGRRDGSAGIAFAAVTATSLLFGGEVTISQASINKVLSTLTGVTTLASPVSTGPTIGISARGIESDVARTVKPLGSSADDWDGLFGSGNIATNAAAAGKRLALTGATYTVSSGLLSQPSNFAMDMAPKTALVSTLTALGTFPGNYVFHTDAPFPVQAAGSLAATPIVGTTTLSVAITTKPVVGHYLQLKHGLSAAVYKVMAATGTSSPWTITIDRPTNLPWTSAAGGDIVDEYASRPSNLRLNCQGTMTGGGDGISNFVRTSDLQISGVRFVPDGGLPKAGIGLDLGCGDGLVSECAVDFTGAAGGLGQQCFYAQSSERFTYRRCYAKNGAVAGIEILDCVGALVEDCIVEGCLTGILLSSFGVGPDGKTSYGSYDSQIRGGYAASCNVGAWIAGVGPSYNCVVENFAAIACTNEGIIVGSGSVAGRVLNCDVRGSNIGLLVQAGATDTKIVNLRADSCLSAAVSCAADLDVYGLNSTVNYAGNGVVVLSGGSEWRLRSIDVTQSNGAAYGILVTAAGRLELDGANITVAGSGIGIWASVTGITTVIRNTKITSDQGIFTAAGATTILGDGLDFSGCTAGSWFTGSGTVKGNGFAGLSSIAMTTADHTATWAEFYAGTIVVTGTLGAPRSLVMPKISVPWEVRNGADQTLTVKCSSGTGVDIPPGAKARVIFDGTNVTAPSVWALASDTLLAAASSGGPTIKQADLTTNSGTGASLTIQAQNETGTTSTGGNIVLKSGTGTSTRGNASLIGNTMFLESTSIQITDLAGPSTALTITPAPTGATSITTASGVTSLTLDASAGASTALTLKTGSGSNMSFNVGASTTVLALNSTAALLGVPTLSFGGGLLGPTIQQDVNATNGAIGQTLIVQAQGCSGTTSTGGTLQLKCGAGTSTYGSVQIVTTVVRLTANATGLGLYGATPVAQPARINQLTDSTAGTPGTTLASVVGTTYSTDIPTIRNWAASLAAKVNAIELALHNLGVTS